MSDEYTDPYDAVRANARLRKMPATDRSAVDGYIEPYDAQQMYHGMYLPTINKKTKIYTLFTFASLVCICFKFYFLTTTVCAKPYQICNYVYKFIG